MSKVGHGGGRERIVPMRRPKPKVHRKGRRGKRQPVAKSYPNLLNLQLTLPRLNTGSACMSSRAKQSAVAKNWPLSFTVAWKKSSYVSNDSRRHRASRELARARGIDLLGGGDVG